MRIANQLRAGRFGGSAAAFAKSRIIGNTYYRTNQIWQHRTLKCRSDIEGKKLVTRNFAVVKYQPAEFTDLMERNP